MVGWSLVKLASDLLHLFHANGWKLLWHIPCCFQEEWLCLLSFVVCCLYLMMSLYLFRHFGKCYPVLSGQMPSYHVFRRQGFDSHILVTQDPLCELSPYVHLIIDSWWNLLQGVLACNDWSLSYGSSRESPVSIAKTYPYDTYHDCDTTLVTLGSVLTHFF